MSKQLLENIESVKRVEGEFKAIQKENSHTVDDFKTKSSVDIARF